MILLENCKQIKISNVRISDYNKSIRNKKDNNSDFFLQ
jgi:hypothetical protein